MALSRQYLLPLLSGSALLCSLWVAQLPARAQVEADPSPQETAVEADPEAALVAPAAVESAAVDPALEQSAAGQEATQAQAEPETQSTAAEPGTAEPGAEPSAEPSAAEPNSKMATPEAAASEAAVDSAVEPAAASPSTAAEPAASPRLISQETQSAPLAQEPNFNIELPASPATVDFNDPGMSGIPQDLLTDYVLGPGDQILLLVLGYEEFTGARVVLPDGTITVPLIGSVPAAGRTLEALSNDVQSRLAVYLTDPVVDANLTVLRPVVVNIAGEVYRPGPVQLSSLTQVNTVVNPNANITNATNTPTLSSALAAAGGIRRTADIRSIVIQRRLPNGDTREFTINLWDAIATGRDPGVVVLADGDSVFVPVARSGETLDPRLIASSSFAPTNVRVRVVGEVERPGEVTVQPNSSISSAVAAAGGPTDDARLNNVLLVRLNESGQIEEQAVDLSSLIDNNQIQDGDVVVVPKKGYLNVLDTVARALSPILTPLNILNLFNVFDNDD